MKTRNVAALFRSFARLALWLTAARGDAQFALDWFTLDGGGGTSAGGNYSLTGTVGQPDATVSSGGNYEMQGGFWGAFTAGPVTNPPALRITRDGASVLLAWPEPAPGFQLQKSSSLTTPDWTDVITPPVLVGAEQQVTQPLAPGARFYRLHRP